MLFCVIILIRIILRDGTSEYKDSGKLVSYYDLLSLLKTKVRYEEVILHKFDNTMTYIFDGDSYIIAEEKLLIIDLKCF